MSVAQTEKNTDRNPVVPLPDPPAPVISRQRTTYNVYIHPDSLDAIHDWLLSVDESPTDHALVDALPARSGDDDLPFLGTYPGANKDAAVDAMLNDEKSKSNRVRLVQAAYAAHLDLYFSAPPVSYLKAVPREWEQTWTPKAGGR